MANTKVTWRRIFLSTSFLAQDKATLEPGLYCGERSLPEVCRQLETSSGFRITSRVSVSHMDAKVSRLHSGRSGVTSATNSDPRKRGESSLCALSKDGGWPTTHEISFA